MKSAFLPAVLASALSPSAWAPAVESPAVTLPTGLAEYKTWSSLAAEPQPVPLALWLKCSASTKDDIASAYKAHGPHAERYIRVYANALAIQTLRSTVSRAFPTGAVIAKEKLVQATDSAPSGVAFMVKREGSAFRETGGWEFQYFPTTGDARQIHHACAACHSSAVGSGYVLGEYAKK